MKKILLAILTFFYMSISTGIAMEIHYCMGKKIGVDLFHSGSDTCGKCGMTESKTGCCSDDYKFLKLQDEHKNTGNQIAFNSEITSVISFFNQFDSSRLIPTAKLFKNYSLQFDTGPTICIKNCVFRI